LDFGSDLLSLTFDRAADLPTRMRREVKQHGWPVAGPGAYPRVLAIERDGVARPLTERDVRLVAACADALGPFVLKHTALFAGKRLEPASESYTGPTELTVRLTAPYEAFDLFEDGLKDDAAPQLALPAFARDESAELGPGWFSVPFALTGPGLPSLPGAPPDVRAALPASEFELSAAVGGRRRVGRNDPCPCGSGKKYKRCHLGADVGEPGGPTGAEPGGPTAPRETAALHELDRGLADVMAGYARERFGEAWLRFELDFADAEAASQLSLHWALYHLRVRGRSVAGRFLAERGERLSGEERAWLEAQSRSWLSIWEVQSARPGESLDLEDLLTGERRHVVEASGSRMLVPRTAVLARIVDHGGLSLICGSHPQPLPPLAAADVASAYRRRLRRGSISPTERLREERLGRDLIADWEDAIAGLEERSRIPPRLHNTDGDELVFVTDRFDLDVAARAEIEAPRRPLLPALAPRLLPLREVHIEVLPDGSRSHKPREDPV
ncbi:MAG: SEC-C metal-binding domain-containing protein, partial [Chloroflexota bacterium]